tara:strand:- start:36 stop:683 length:648 start_codon:yes stop_codon:yes gene_type:complete
MSRIPSTLGKTMQHDQLQKLRMLGAGILVLGMLGWGTDFAFAKDDPKTVQRYIRITSWGSSSIRLRPLKQPLRPLQSEQGKTGRSAKRLMRDMRWIKLSPEKPLRKGPLVKIRPHIPKTTKREVQLGRKIRRITAPQIRRLSQREVAAGYSAKSLSRSKGYTVTPEAIATGHRITSVVRKINQRPLRPKANPLAHLQLQREPPRGTSNPLAGMQP